MGSKMKYFATLLTLLVCGSRGIIFPPPSTRSSFVRGTMSGFLGIVVASGGAMRPAEAEESLLSQFGSDSKVITQQSKASNRDLGSGKVMVGKSEGSIDPNLR